METTLDRTKPSPKDAQVDRLLTADELADMLNVRNRRSIYNRLYSGCLGIPVVRIGSLLRFRLKDVERFLERGGTPKE